MPTTPATDEAVVWAACLQVAAELHKDEIQVEHGASRTEKLIEIALEYYDESIRAIPA